MIITNLPTILLKQISPLLFLSALFFASCDPGRVYEENKEIDEGVWNSEDKISFEVDVQDTVTPHNFYINVRNASPYPFRNLFLFVTCTFPDGETVIQDTIECILADEAGVFMGSGLGDIWDSQHLYRKGIVFPMKGTYVFEYQQAMRKENLPFIMDVGLRVERME